MAFIAFLVVFALVKFTTSDIGAFSVNGSPLVTGLYPDPYLAAHMAVGGNYLYGGGNASGNIRNYVQPLSTSNAGIVGTTATGVLGTTDPATSAVVDTHGRIVGTTPTALVNAGLVAANNAAAAAVLQQQQQQQQQSLAMSSPGGPIFPTIPNDPALLTQSVPGSQILINGLTRSHRYGHNPSSNALYHPAGIVGPSTANFDGSLVATNSADAVPTLPQMALSSLPTVVVNHHYYPSSTHHRHHHHHHRP